MPSGQKLDANVSVEDAFLKIMETAEGRELAHYCYYDWDVLGACRRFEESEEWPQVSGLIDSYRAGGEALDLGAGNGIGSYALARKGFRVTAIEPDPSGLVGYGALLGMVEKTGLPIKHVAAFGEKLPFEDESFDLVYARQVLHHASDLNRMLAEIARVLKRGGIFIACREHVVDDPQSREVFLSSHPLHCFTKGEGAFTLDEYVGAIRSCGLGLKRAYGSWDSVINHYPVSNHDLINEMSAYARKRFPGIGWLLPLIPAWRKRYRRLKTASDKLPGRMHSFVARKD